MTSLKPSRSRKICFYKSRNVKDLTSYFPPTRRIYFSGSIDPCIAMLSKGRLMPFICILNRVGAFLRSARRKIVCRVREIGRRVAPRLRIGSAVLQRLRHADERRPYKVIPRPNLHAAPVKDEASESWLATKSAKWALQVSARSCRAPIGAIRHCQSVRILVRFCGHPLLHFSCGWPVFQPVAGAPTERHPLQKQHRDKIA